MKIQLLRSPRFTAMVAAGIGAVGLVSLVGCGSGEAVKPASSSTPASGSECCSATPTAPATKPGAVASPATTPTDAASVGRPLPDANPGSTTAPADAAAAAPQPNQKVFATAEEAATALKDAATAKDQQQLVSLFGEEGKQLIFSGDPVAEQNGMTKFAGHLAEYLRVDEPTPTRAILYIGRHNWPFPIPLVKGTTGWFFDTAAGKEELLNRRIGENELNAIAVCRAYFAAQKAYAAKDRTGDKITQYAQHFMSSEGKKDGLYWAAGDNEEASPMGPLVAEAQMEGYLKDPTHKPGQHRPYKGYFFHILNAQGEAAPGGKMSYLVDGKMTKGFAMIAWPAAYDSSGIMTFIINQDGKVFQKNLGEKTADAVKEISEYNPDSTWGEVKE